MLSHTIEYDQLEPIEALRNLPVGKRLVIAGESYAGPYYEPTIAYNLRIAESIFKSGPLIERYRDAITIDDSIELVFIRIRDQDYPTLYKCLQSYSFDLIYIDQFDINQKNIESFIDFALDKEDQGDLVHGFFNLEIDQDLHQIKDMIEKFTFEDITDKHEMGKYVSLVSDQIHNHTSAMNYATLIASIDPGVSPVNKPLNVELDAEWPKEKLLFMQQIGVVAFRKSILNGVVCANSTCAVRTPGSVHKNIANFRIAQYLIQELSNAFHNRIGEYQSSSQIRHIQGTIEQKIEEYIVMDRIRSGEYSIMNNEFEGKIFINLSIVPIFSTQQITAHSQVRIIR